MTIGSVSREAAQAAFRMVPWATPTGLRKVGNPGRTSPVLVTGNYDLTVRRLLAAVQGIDAWIVVAESKGINVWCAAAGGHFTSHQVITALKTSGIEDLVDHRRAILPQLAATGVLAREVWRRCHWNVRFGPVRADQIPAYLRAGGNKTDDMRRVTFGAAERLEMSAAWGVPMAILMSAVFAFLRPGWVLPLAALSIALALVVFFAYERIPNPRKLVFVGGGAVAVLAMALGSGATALSAAELTTLTGVMAAILTYDYEGSTPLLGGSFFEGQDWRITLDLERCQGVFSCWEVCPEACFERNAEERTVDLAHDERCIRCGACIVQCPQDALYFQDEQHRRIAPETIRRFKLNLLGQRVAKEE